MDMPTEWVMDKNYEWEQTDGIVKPKRRPNESYYIVFHTATLLTSNTVFGLMLTQRVCSGSNPLPTLKART